MDCIRISREFSSTNKEGYRGFISQTFTYGAATYLDLQKGEGVNFCAHGDFVPSINSRNLKTEVLNQACVKYTSFRLQSPFAAHAFEGPSYQEAFQQAIISQYEG